ncbi:MAG: hypothetical protein LBO70_07430 [Clostridiales Family XIII bacterium]|nr:hypothetical protein [Clostridiales Family XIII bacterium]
MRVIAVVCVVAIIAGATTAASFAITGHDPITVASNLVQGRALLAPVKAEIKKSLAKDDGQLILRENGVTIYSYDGGKTWGPRVS